MGNFICGNQEQLNPGAQGKMPGILQRGPFANMRNKNQQHDGSLRPPHVLHRQRHRHGGLGRPLKLQQFANQMRVGASQTRKRSMSFDTRGSHQQFSTRSFGKVCREYQEKGVTKQQQSNINNMVFKENEKKVSKTFKNRRNKSSGTFQNLNRQNFPTVKSFSKLETSSTEDKLFLPSLKPMKESSFFIARKLRSLGGFGGGDDNEQFFDCLGQEGKCDKSAGKLTNNNKQNSNGELTFMPRTASKKEQDGGLTFSDSEVEVEEEEESYYGGGRILCIRRGFRWPRRKLLSEEHKDEVVPAAQKDSISNDLSGDNNHKIDKNNRIQYCESDDLDNESADSDRYIFTRNRANSECLECTGQCKPKLLDELELDEKEEQQQMAAYVDNDNIIKEEETMNPFAINDDQDEADKDFQKQQSSKEQKEDDNQVNDEQQEQEQKEQENKPETKEDEEEYEKADELIDHY